MTFLQNLSRNGYPVLCKSAKYANARAIAFTQPWTVINIFDAKKLPNLPVGTGEDALNREVLS